MVFQPASIIDRETIMTSYLQIYSRSSDERLRRYIEEYREASPLKRFLMDINPFVDHGSRAKVAQKILEERASRTDI